MRLITSSTVRFVTNHERPKLVSKIKRDLPPGSDGDLEHAIRLALKGLQFGSVEITIHNSHVVQIERIEKTSFEGTQPPSFDDSQIKIHKVCLGDQLTSQKD